MSLDLNTIKDYVDENSMDIKTRMTIGGSTISNFSIQTGVKSPSAVNIMNTDAIFQDGSLGGWTPQGTTTFSQRLLVPGDIKVQEGINPKDVNKTYMTHLVSAGSYESDLQFAEYYTNLKLNAIISNTEKAIWQGDVTSTNGQLNRFDGFLKIIDNEATVINGNISNATVITKDNVIAIVDDMYAVLDTDSLEKDDLRLAVGYDVAKLYVSAHKDLDLRNYDAIAGTFEFIIPATNVKMFATSGLNGTSRMILTSAKNAVIGVDLENDEEAFSMRYSEEEFVVKYHANFKKAVQVAFPEQIVEFTLSV